MQKVIDITKKRDAERASLVKKTADITGVTERSVRRVIRGDQDNEYVLSVYMELLEGTNKLLEYVKLVVPFETNYRAKIKAI